MLLDTMGVINSCIIFIISIWKKFTPHSKDILWYK